VRQLTSIDAQFLAVEDGRNHAHVSSLAVYDPSTAPGGELTLAALRALIRERLHLTPPFRWRLVEVPLGLDYPYWIDDPDFDLEFHVRELALPAPGDERQLSEQVARIHARPLDRARPLWELYLIHGLDRGRVALLTKVHHAAVDGLSGAEIIGALLDPSPEGREIPHPPEDQPGEQPPSQLELLGRGLAGLPRQPLRALGSVPRALPNLDQVPTVRSLPGVRRIGGVATRLAGLRGDGGVLERPDLRAPRVSVNGRITPHRRFAFGSLSLDEVKAIKNELGFTVNDVVVAICAGALRRRLAARGELPAEPLLAMIPISVRAPEERGTFGNRVSSHPGAGVGPKGWAVRPLKRHASWV